MFSDSSEYLKIKWDLSVWKFVQTLSNLRSQRVLQSTFVILAHKCSKSAPIKNVDFFGLCQ